MHAEWRECERPDDTAFVVVLFDGCGHNARHTDAVAPHDERLFYAVVVQEGGLHGLGVFGAQIEDLADFDTAEFGEGTATASAGITCTGEAHFGPEIDIEVSIDVDAGVEEAIFVGADDRAAQA